MTGSLEELDDLALLQAHREGDPVAFGVLFTRHRDRLWAVALRTTGHPEDASDALQEALISAFKRAGEFRGDAQVTTWLHRIVVNASLDRLRRNKVRAAQPLPDDLEEQAARGAVVGTPHDDGDPAVAALRSDQQRAILAALARIPGEQRAALVLVDMEGYPVEEASRILGCPVGTVKSRCARGRHRLVGILGEMGVTGTTRPAGASDPGVTASEGGAR
ncbi:MAG: RNA polymerase sigma factor SigM [Propionibacteriales bacterium]|nr:RNA polymerase sigma factor SigM [Propionibacteriales bacterium]